MGLPLDRPAQPRQPAFQIGREIGKAERRISQGGDNRGKTAFRDEVRREDGAVERPEFKARAGLPQGQSQPAALRGKRRGSEFVAAVIADDRGGIRRRSRRGRLFVEFLLLCLLGLGAGEGVVDGMLRIAVGLEDPADLCDDLDQALSTI